MKDSALTGWEITRKYLIERRDELGMSSYQLAKVAGLAESQVSRYLSGEVTPSVIAFYQLIGALELNPYLVPKEMDTIEKPNRIFFN